MCDKKWMVSSAQSIFMFGILTGAVIFSALSDRWVIIIIYVLYSIPIGIKASPIILYL